MDNPWKNLPIKSPFVVEADAQIISAHNDKCRTDKYRFQTSVVLEGSSMYLWVKAFHIIAMAAWMAPLLVCPRYKLHQATSSPGEPLFDTEISAMGAPFLTPCVRIVVALFIPHRPLFKIVTRVSHKDTN